MNASMPLVSDGPPFLRRADRAGDDVLDMLLEASLRDPTLQVVRIPCRGAAYWPDVYRRLSETLRLLPYFGDNLDALFESLREPEVLGDKHVLIVLLGVEELLEREAEGSRFQLLSVFSDAGKYWHQEGDKTSPSTRLHTYLHFGARIPDDLMFVPVFGPPDI